MECAGQHQGEVTATAGGKGERRGWEGATAGGMKEGGGEGEGQCQDAEGDTQGTTKRGRKEERRGSGERTQPGSTSGWTPSKQTVLEGHT